MAYEREGSKLAVELASQYGELLEARCESRSPWKITLIFSRGRWDVPSNFIFKFGYSGSGVDCFHAFLQASGLDVSKAAVEDAGEGTVFRHSSRSAELTPNDSSRPGPGAANVSRGPQAQAGGNSDSFTACPNCGETEWGPSHPLEIYRCACGMTYCDRCSGGGLVTLPRCPVSPYHDNLIKAGVVQPRGQTECSAGAGPADAPLRVSPTSSGEQSHEATATPSALRGGMGEPYCSERCYKAAGKDIGAAILHGFDGECGFCRRPVRLSVGSANSAHPFRTMFLYVCPGCRSKAEAHAAEIRECCFCGRNNVTAPQEAVEGVRPRHTAADEASGAPMPASGALEPDLTPEAKSCPPEAEPDLQGPRNERQSLQCSRCQAINPVEAEYCYGCLEPLAPADSRTSPHASPHSGAPTRGTRPPPVVGGHAGAAKGRMAGGAALLVGLVGALLLWRSQAKPRGPATQRPPAQAAAGSETGRRMAPEPNAAAVPPGPAADTPAPEQRPDAGGASPVPAGSSPERPLIREDGVYRGPEEVVYRVNENPPKPVKVYRYLRFFGGSNTSDPSSSGLVIADLSTGTPGSWFTRDGAATRGSYWVEGRDVRISLSGPAGQLSLEGTIEPTGALSLALRSPLTGIKGPKETYEFLN